MMPWLRGVDLNHRPLGYEPNELPGCSTPQNDTNSSILQGQTTIAMRLLLEQACVIALERQAILAGLQVY